MEHIPTGREGLQERVRKIRQLAREMPDPAQSVLDHLANAVEAEGFGWYFEAADAWHDLGRICAERATRNDRRGED